MGGFRNLFFLDESVHFYLQHYLEGFSLSRFISPFSVVFRSGIFTPHSVLFTNLIGPPGLLLHWVTCLVTGKGFGGENEAEEEDEFSS